MAKLTAKQERDFSDALYSEGSEYERSSKEFMRRLVPRDRRLRILDVGGGTGLNARALRDMGHDLVSIDISPVAVEKLGAAGFDAHLCDVTEGVPFADNAFDLVYASDVVEHLSDTAFFLDEMFRVLKPSGQLLMSTPNSAFWPFRILAVLGQTASEMQHPWHLRFFSKRGLNRLVATAGFSDINISGRHMYLVCPDVIGRPLGGLLRTLGFEREYRLTTDTYFWHLPRYARRASPFWADSLIVAASKPAD